MRERCSWRLACAGWVLLVVMGCGSATSVPTDATPTLPPAPVIPDSAATCAQAPALAGAQATAFYDLNFPDDGIATGTITSAASAPMQVVAYVACLRIDQSFGPPTPMGSAQQQVIATLGFFARGWAFSKVFPTDGKTLRACAALQSCFAVGKQTYALLEQTRANPNGLAVFYLSLALPRPPVPCDPILFPFYTYPNSIAPSEAARIPLPPDTRVSIARSAAQGITEFFCSAGSASAVSAFMQQHLPQAGWTLATVAGQQLWTITPRGAPPLSMRLNPITNPRDWSEVEYERGAQP